MPITRRLRPRNGVLIAAGILTALLQSSACGASPVAVGVVRDAVWSPDDPSREGAGEFTVLLQLAQLQRSGAQPGLLGVGAPRGVFAPGAERALRFAAFNGVAVVKVASRGDVAACPDEIFVDAGALTEEQAEKTLRDALSAVGAPPRAANPLRPTELESAAVRLHVRRIQRHFVLANSAVIARN